LISVYAELQQAYSRAVEAKASGRRQLSTYFRVFFYGLAHFHLNHKSEWIYRERGRTSLAEACDRMRMSCESALGHDRVRVIAAENVTSFYCNLMSCVLDLVRLRIDQ
jgi:hypothetical protein